jgi:hypothetical protein
MALGNPFLYVWGDRLILGVCIFIFNLCIGLPREYPASERSKPVPVEKLLASLLMNWF